MVGSCDQKQWLRVPEKNKSGSRWDESGRGGARWGGYGAGSGGVGCGGAAPTRLRHTAFFPIQSMERESFSFFSLAFRLKCLEVEVFGAQTSK